MLSILCGRLDQMKSGEASWNLGNASAGVGEGVGFSFSGFRYVRPKTPSPIFRIEFGGAGSWVVEGGGMAMLWIKWGWRMEGDETEGKGSGSEASSLMMI